MDLTTETKPKKTAVGRDRRTPVPLIDSELVMYARKYSRALETVDGSTPVEGLKKFLRDEEEPGYHRLKALFTLGMCDHPVRCDPDSDGETDSDDGTAESDDSSSTIEVDEYQRSLAHRGIWLREAQLMAHACMTHYREPLDQQELARIMTWIEKAMQELEEERQNFETTCAEQNIVLLANGDAVLVIGPGDVDDDAEKVDSGFPSDFGTHDSDANTNASNNIGGTPSNEEGFQEEGFQLLPPQFLKRHQLEIDDLLSTSDYPSSVNDKIDEQTQDSDLGSKYTVIARGASSEADKGQHADTLSAYHDFLEKESLSDIKTRSLEESHGDRKVHFDLENPKDEES